MTNQLKVLSVNFPFKDRSVKQIPDFNTALAFFDFDVVVIRPFSPFGNVARSTKIDWPEFVELKNFINSKNDDFYRLLANGGVLVLILDVLQAWTCRTGGYSLGEIHTLTNYDFLEDRFLYCVGNGTGDRVTITDSAGPFAKVLKKSTVRWTAFMKALPNISSESWRVFAKNAPDGIIGATVGMAQGHIILLPNFLALDEQEFLDACREYRFKRQASAPPSWVTDVYLPGEAEADRGVVDIDAELIKVRERRNEAIARRDGLLEYKRLLFEKGKTHLEPIVRRALDTLGFNTTESEVIAGTNFEIDGRTTVGSTPGIIEVKGSKNQIGLDEISPFIPKVLEDFKVKEAQSKAILVGNGLCEQPASERLGDKVFSGHAIGAAKTSSVALVNSVELYWLVCSILAGQAAATPETIREAILGTTGYVDLKKFCGTSPFT